MNIEEIWWTRMNNTIQFQNDIRECIANGTSAILCFPPDVPWCGALECYLQLGAFRITNVLSAPRNQKPGEFILEKYCTSEMRADYWPTQTYGEFLAANRRTVLNQRIVFVKDILPEDGEAWIQFLKDYLSHCDSEQNHGIFLLSIRTERKLQIKEAKTFCFSDYVTDYDCLNLCYTVVSGLSIPSVEKQYIASLAYTLAPNNIMLAGILAEEGSALTFDPFAIGMEQEIPKEQIATAVWEAQLKEIFPIIERYRNYFIQTYEKQLKTIMPVKVNGGTETVYEPKELEIGELYFFCHTLTSIDAEDRKCLKVMRDARNQLAHCSSLDSHALKNIWIYERTKLNKKHRNASLTGSAF